jgi:predicted RecA/RadA family phage recombinase
MFRPKGGAMAPDQIHHFVNEVVVLVSNGTLWKLDEQSAVYKSGSSIQPQLVVSNYHSEGLSGCNINWSVSLVAAAATPFSHGSISDIAVPQGTVQPVGAPLRIALPAVENPSRFNLTVSLTCTELDTPRLNDWQAWVYPSVTPVPGNGTTKVFASASIATKVKAIAPKSEPLPTTTLQSSSDAVYVLSQNDLLGAAPGVAAQLLASVEDGSTLLIPETTPCVTRSCDGRAQCVPPACNETVIDELLPFNLMEPLLFHAPWWTNDAVTPTALLTNKAAKDRESPGQARKKDPLFWSCWPDCDKEQQQQKKKKQQEDEEADDAAVPATAALENPPVAPRATTAVLPAGLAMMSNEDGRVDDGWFSGFGPVPSSCPGRVRSAVAFKGRTEPKPPVTWPCPKSYPFPSVYYNGLCYNESRYAHAKGGPCHSWCSDDPKHPCTPCSGPCTCKTAVQPNVTVCPKEFPFNSSKIPALCFSEASYAAAGSGPCDSWCTKRVWSGCGCACGCGCGDPATRICGMPRPAPPPPPESFVQQLARRNGSLWLAAVFGSNFASPAAGGGSSGDPMAGVIYSIPKGKGRVIVSGVDIDLTQCGNNEVDGGDDAATHTSTAAAAAAAPNPHELFDQNLLRALLGAALGE